PPTPALYTLSLHDALPICRSRQPLSPPDSRKARPCSCLTQPPGPMDCTCLRLALTGTFAARLPDALLPDELNLGLLCLGFGLGLDRKSTRLNSSHLVISYA